MYMFSMGNELHIGYRKKICIVFLIPGFAFFQECGLQVMTDMVTLGFKQDSSSNLATGPVSYLPGSGKIQPGYWPCVLPSRLR